MRLSTMSRNSCDVGTGWISFHVVFMVGEGWTLTKVGVEDEDGDSNMINSEKGIFFLPDR